MSTPAVARPRSQSRTVAAAPLVHVEGLTVGFRKGREINRVVDDISFTLNAGRTLALVGESGSGKSVTARALMGLAGHGSTVSASRLAFDGHSLLALRARQWRELRGRRIGMILQDALVSLDPLRPAGREVEEPLQIHRFGTRAERHARVIEVLRQAGIPDPESRARQRSGELSGGLRQRALIAAALALDPDLLIADEPTTALDTTVQAQIIGVLKEAQQRGKSLLLISHDLAIVAQLADDIVVMRQGRLIESGSVDSVLGNPQAEYTKQLLAAIPSARTRGTRLSSIAPRSGSLQVAPGEGPVLSVAGVSKRFATPDGSARLAVDEVSFDVGVGETVGIVGESGSGKSTTARIALGVERPDSGTVEFEGAPWSSVSERRRRALRSKIAVVTQDALGSFDPRWSVEQIVTDAFSPHLSRRERHAKALGLLDLVGLASTVLDRRPITLSGGQRQRVSIARAIARTPRLLVLDEPVSALDVSIQAQVLDLFADLKAELGLSYLFISHDLGVISHVSDRILVMKDGRVIEQGRPQSVFAHPQHEYTALLVRSVPEIARA